MITRLRRDDNLLRRITEIFRLGENSPSFRPSGEGSFGASRRSFALRAIIIPRKRIAYNNEKEIIL